MAMMVGMDGTGSSSDKEGGGRWAEEGGIWGKEGGMDELKAVVPLEGIYDFVACRDAHEGTRELYEAFTAGAFGAEEGGGRGGMF